MEKKGKKRKKKETTLQPFSPSSKPAGARPLNGPGKKREKGKGKKKYSLAFRPTANDLLSDGRLMSRGKKRGRKRVMIFRLSQTQIKGEGRSSFSHW